VCPCCKRKTARAINTKLGTRILRGSGSECVDPEVKRSKVKVAVMKTAMVAWLLVKCATAAVCCCYRRGTACRLTALVFTMRHYASAVYVVMCLCVCFYLSHACIVSKWLNLWSWKQCHMMEGLSFANCGITNWIRFLISWISFLSPTVKSVYMMPELC